MITLQYLELPSGFMHQLKELRRRIRTWYWQYRWNKKERTNTSTLDFLNEE